MTQTPTKRKINQNGNLIDHNFSLAGCNGSEYSLMAHHQKRGFIILFCVAPYHWLLVNKNKKQLFEYVEGDTYLTHCKDKKSFIAEIKDKLQFQKRYNPTACQEMKAELKDNEII